MNDIFTDSRFEEVQQLTNLVFLVKSNQKYGVYRTDILSLIIPCEYDSIKYEGYDFVLLEKSGRWGAKSILSSNDTEYQERQVNIATIYMDIKVLEASNLSFSVKVDPKFISPYFQDKTKGYTIIGKDGEVIYEFDRLLWSNFKSEYVDSHSKFYSLSLIKTSFRGKFGFISLSGYVSVPFKYDEIEDRLDGDFNVRIGNSWGVLDRDGREYVAIKYNFKIPKLINNAIVEDSISHKRGMLSSSGVEIAPTIYDWLFPLGDFYFFGFGGEVIDHICEDYNFLGEKISGGIWGCMDKTGKIIIDAKYPSYQVINNYILAESSNCGYPKYDLYSSKGELIMGGFSLFEKIENGFLFFFGRPYDESIGRYKSDKNKYLEKYGRWLCLDENLISIDGFLHQFKKGFIGDVKREVKDGKAKDTYNMPLELLKKEKPKVYKNYLIYKDGKKEWATNIVSRKSSWVYDEIKFIDDELMLVREGDKFDLTRFTSIAIDPAYSLITLPVDGKYFAVQTIEDRNCRVELVDVDDKEKSPQIAISCCLYEDLLQYVKKGKLLIVKKQDENDNNIIRTVPDLSIFDNSFVKNLHLEIDNQSYLRKEIVYWFSKDIENYVNRDSSFQYNPSEDYDYEKDTWDAMTGGMYGDYPGGDIDYEFLGE